MRPLSEAEFRLMVQLAAGKSRLRLAVEMNISESTLNDRLSAIRSKLNAQTFDQALAEFAKVYRGIQP